MELRNPKVRGIIVPIVTPLTAKKQINAQSVRKIVDYLRPNVDGIVPCLSTGEGRYLDRNMWQRMLELSVAAAGGLLVIAGIEHADVAEVYARAELAHSLGVEVIAVLPPFGEDVSQDVIYAHFAKLSEMHAQVVAYNKKLMSGTAIALSTLVKICALPGVVAVKEGSSDPHYTKALIDSVEGVAILHAWENLLTKTKTHGSIVPLSNLEPELCRKAFENPTAELQSVIDGAVVKYNIGAENMTWFLDVKKELVKRGIISTCTVVA